jgi:bifunctional UDP-N-acetylglucosamine pyrophosphorylase/glucosamine-1-phosphate N-acetyltransferase
MEIISIILAAGKGKRMNSDLPKPLHKIAGKTLMGWLENSLDEVNVTKKIYVLGHQNEKLIKFIGTSDYIIQEPQLGTGHAVNLTKDKIKNHDSIIIIAYADTPFVPSNKIKKMISQIKEGYDISILGFIASNPKNYGRVVKNGNEVIKIVEEVDTDVETKKINLCNSGILAGKAERIYNYLSQVKKSKSGEYFLTDIVSICASKGSKVGIVSSHEEDLIGVNDREDLSKAEQIIQNRLRKQHMKHGVTMLDPSSVFIDASAKLNRDVTIEPNVFIGGNVEIKSKTIIKSFSYLEDCSIGKDCSIGPFARIRPETEIMNNVKIGNFVEVKKSKINKNSKVNHLTYVGDTAIGINSNIGAGTITCNYDGFKKHKTNIGNHVFIGSNVSLIAPLNIKDNSIIGAGSTISKDVEEGTIAVERSKQKELKKRKIRHNKKL